MITKTERKQLKKLLGAHYAEPILELLNKEGITNSHGNPHSLEYIRVVFQGKRKNNDVERVIWNYALFKKKEIQSLKQRKQLILQN